MVVFENVPEEERSRCRIPLFISTEGVRIPSGSTFLVYLPAERKLLVLNFSTLRKKELFFDRFLHPVDNICRNIVHVMGRFGMVDKFSHQFLIC